MGDLIFSSPMPLFLILDKKAYEIEKKVVITDVGNDLFGRVFIGDGEARLETGSFINTIIGEEIPGDHHH
jgi:hypothetical protein